ncbi:unnamed protein product [Lasius platythorax]|uniref:Uncharacterized protein n=1 Tax=Lasius platythorax TaxID=488582 RepID=A0AAV2P696_9HYME
MDPIRAVQCRLKFRSESSKSRVRLQSGSGRPAITSLFYKFRSLFTMIVKSGGHSEESIIAEIKSVERVQSDDRGGSRNQTRCPFMTSNDDDRAKSSWPLDFIQSAANPRNGSHGQFPPT